jgi:SAM-dependent methyltransferase
MDRLPSRNVGGSRDTGAVDPLAFVQAHLPPAPARILEVGCGRGELARAIAGLGYEVVAIDPDAPDGDIFEAVSLEQFADPGPFDAVVAMRALHHIADLEGAVGKIARLLSPGGRLLVGEHAWERLDARTARWYLDRRAARGAAAPPTLERCMRDWTEDHRELHTSAAMRAALDRRFTERYLAWTPYLFGALAPAVTEEEEQADIDAGTIEAMGFSYVGARRP